MQKRLLTTLLALPFAALAQIPGGVQMDEAQMQQLMQQAQQMQTCMENIDQAEMDAFQQKSEAMETEVKALCAAGKRDAAEARAMAFGREMANSSIMQQMKQCGEGMKHRLPNLPQAAQPEEDNDTTPHHVCDE